MSTASARAVGNPVRRLGLRRLLRSQAVAAALVVWTVAVFGVVGAVVIQHTGADRPFHPSTSEASALGRAVGQWWVIAIVVGAAVLAPVVVSVLLAGPREQRVVASWRTTAVTDRQILTGTLSMTCAFVVLALVVTLPAAGMALALGGTSIAQLAVGALGAVLVSVMAAAIAIATSITTRRLSTALVGAALVLGLLFGGTTVLHGFRTGGSPTHRADPVLIANPLIGVADAAAPRAGGDHEESAAAEPLTHLRATVHPHDGAVQPWVASSLVALGATVVAAVVTRIRLVRARSR